MTINILATWDYSESCLSVEELETSIRHAQMQMGIKEHEGNIISFQNDYGSVYLVFSSEKITPAIARREVDKIINAAIKNHTFQ